MPSPESVLTTCPECGATDAPAGGRCWLCHAQVPGTAAPPAIVQATLIHPVEATVVAGPPQYRAGEIASGIALGLILLVLLLMGIGMAVDEPGMLIPFLIVVVPALIATGARGAARRMEGRPLSWSQRLVTFAISASATIGALALLCVAAFVAFFIYCIAAMTNMNL